MVGSSHCGSMEMNQTTVHEAVSSILALLSGFRIQLCPELWCRAQIGLGSCVAVPVVWPTAVAPIQPPAWELPYAAGVALKRGKKRERERRKEKEKENNVGYCLLSYFFFSCLFL